MIGTSLMPDIKILIAEDDPSSAHLLASLVERWGGTPVVVNSGAEAWDTLTQHPDIRIALIDWMMPGLKGPELCERIRRCITDRYIYLLLVTSRSDEADVVAGMEAGADDYVCKPLNANLLRVRLDAGLRIVKLNEEYVLEQERLRRQEQIVSETLAAKEHLIASMPGFFVSIDMRDRITAWNPAAEHFFGVPAARTLGQSLFKLGITWDWTVLCAAIAEAVDKRCPVEISELQFTTRSAQERIAELRLAPLLTPDRLVKGVVIIGEDITDNKVLSRQLANAQRMESLGQIASGVAHEVTVPMQYIEDNTQFVRSAFADCADLINAYRKVIRELENRGEFSETVDAARVLEKECDLEYLMTEVPLAIEQMKTSVERVTGVVRALREFAHPGSRERSDIDVNQALTNALTVTRNEWKKVADLVTEFSSSLRHISGFAAELNLVFLSLIMNAVHAVGAQVGKSQSFRGMIRITTREFEEGVEIRISDNGPGIPSTVRHKIFDEFSAIRAPGSGVDSGLKVVHDVVAQLHGGDIKVHSEAGRGTEFIIRLPFVANRTRARNYTEPGLNIQ